MQINAFDCLAISLSSTFLFVRDHRRRGGLPYPPGPPSWPIIGNLLDVPMENPWSAYVDMSKKYGDVVCLRVYSQVIVVLCSLSAIKDLLERRGEVFSERPSSQILRCKLGTKMLDGSLRPSALISYRQLIEEMTRGFLVQLQANPRASVLMSDGQLEELTLSITYGHGLMNGDKHLESTVRAYASVRPLVLPGGALVNHSHSLFSVRHIPSWVPYLSHERLARTVRKLSATIKNEPIDLVKNALVCCDHTLSARVGNLPVVGSERQKQEEVVAVTMGSMYRGEPVWTQCVFLDIPAGFSLRNTIENVSAITSFFLALILFPRVQRRAQTELDVVIGRDRLPTFDDRSRLPYIEALCKELLRWKMVTPVGVAHSPGRDDVYRGFFIPKVRVLYLRCFRAILHDPEIYPDPEEFKPERFLNEDGSVRDDPTLSLAFGIGKRICPGRHLAEAIIFTTVSSVLSVFDVSKGKDQSGNMIPVKEAVSTERRVVVHLEKFQCSILPRDKAAENLIFESASP
ncbi:cytochrome P450 [Russula aff. rugulosa BPL654]|nr:cytochrome P450 [Russula aff. rugulosa BPL654]